MTFNDTAGVVVSSWKTTAFFCGAAARLSRRGFLLAVAAFALGCTAEKPQILQVQAELSLRFDAKDSAAPPQEELSVFALVQHGDGFEDIEELYIAHDAAELYWRLDRQTWQHYREGGNWVGSDRLSMPPGKRVPSGRYRVIVVDVGGDEAETAFFVSPDKGPELDPPHLFAVDGELIISSPVGPVMVSVFDRATGALLERVALDPGPVAPEGPLSFTAEEAVGRQVYLRYHHEARERGVISGPFQPAELGLGSAPTR